MQLHRKDSLMSNGANAHSHVTTVHLMQDGTVQVNVLFDGFRAGEPVEISGYVTQTDGAYSSFYSYMTVPGDPTQPPAVVEMPVIIDEGIDDLRLTDLMTVVTKVAKVWPTVLVSGPAGTATTSTATTGTGTTGEIAATWTAQPPPKGANW
jgi:hypothetical protein